MMETKQAESMVANMVNFMRPTIVPKMTPKMVSQMDTSLAGIFHDCIVQPLNALKEPVSRNDFFKGIMQVHSNNLHLGMLYNDSDIPFLEFVPGNRQGRVESRCPLLAYSGNLSTNVKPGVNIREITMQSLMSRRSLPVLRFGLQISLSSP